MPTVNENFIFYADYYAFAARAGLRRSQMLTNGFTPSISADPATVVLPVNFDVAKNNLSRAFDLAYESLFQDAQSLTAMQRAFTSLAAYILSKENTNVNTFITNEGIKVFSTYAQIHNIVSDTTEAISSSNIKVN